MKVDITRQSIDRMLDESKEAGFPTEEFATAAMVIFKLKIGQIEASQYLKTETISKVCERFVKNWHKLETGKGKNAKAILNCMAFQTFLNERQKNNLKSGRTQEYIEACHHEDGHIVIYDMDDLIV